MVRSRFGALSALLSFGVLTASCGSDQRGPAVPEVARPVAAAGDGAIGPIDTARPKDLFFVARFRDPEDTLDAASALSGSPLSMAISILAQTESGKGLSQVDLRSPIDVAAVLPPGARISGSSDDESPPPMVGVTFAVHDVDRATASLPAGWSARPSRAGLRIVGEGGVLCEAPTRGHVPARIFCASSEAAARVLGGWMTQTLFAEPSPVVDARLTFLGAPLRPVVRSLVGTELRDELAQSRESLAAVGVTDPELVAVPTLLVDELEALAEDADQVDIDIDLDGKGKTANAKTTLKFRSTTGWVARVLADPAGRRGPPPAIFWRAPKDSDSASWSMSASPQHFTGIRRVIDKSVRISTSKAGLTPDESDAIAAAVHGIPVTPGAWFAAQGTIPWKAPPRGNPTPQNAIADLKDRARSYVGWGLVGFESPAKPWLDWIGQLETAWKKGVVVAKRELKGSSDLEDVPDLRLVRSPAGYPAGSLAVDLIGKFDSKLAWATSPRLPLAVDGERPEHPAGKPARGTATLRFVVVPDGDTTLVGWSLDDASLRAHVRASLHDAPSSATIASRADLGRLKRDGTGGGYFTLGSWADMFAQVAASEDPDFTEASKALASLPNKAATPILTFADGTTGGAPTLTFEVLAQEGTIEDLRALTAYAMSKGIESFLRSGPATSEPPLMTPIPMPAPAPLTP